MDGQEEKDAVVLPAHGDLAFAGLMDALAPEGEDAGAGGPAPSAGGAQPDDGAAGGATPAGGAEAGGAGDAAAGQPAGAEGGRAGAAPGDGSEGADGAADGGAADAAAPGGAAAGAGTVEAAAVIPRLGDLSNAVEENLVNGYRTAAYEDVRREHGKYFEALEAHPRMLVGKQVPSLTGEGTETLRSTDDAREWQEAVKGLLVQEIEGRAGTWMQDATGFMEVIHGAIDLFKNNPDLIPGTKGFDRQLADRFAGLAKAYEVRIDGKLHGYSVPVQPIIDSLRQDIAAARKVAAPRATAPAAAPARQPEQPQAGIRSKAPTSSGAEDFSTLFGTIGLPHLKI